VNSRVSLKKSHVKRGSRERDCRDLRVLRWSCYEGKVEFAGQYSTNQFHREHCIETDLKLRKEREMNG
jgi:hypothetical protein